MTSMSQASVRVFFYGSYMNLHVLREVDYVPGAWAVARVSGFDIAIRPRANLVRSDRDCVYGIVATATHDELQRLYTHARTVLGETYLPEAVLAEMRDGTFVPALCYIAPNIEPGPPDHAYIDRIVGAAKELGFPEWYIARLERFRQ